MAEEVLFEYHIVRRAEVDSSPTHSVVPCDRSRGERAASLCLEGTVGDDTGAGVLNEALRRGDEIEDKIELAKVRGGGREGHGAASASSVHGINLIGRGGGIADGVG